GVMTGRFSAVELKREHSAETVSGNSGTELFPGVPIQSRVHHPSDGRMLAETLGQLQGVLAVTFSPQMQCLDTADKQPGTEWTYRRPVAGNEPTHRTNQRIWASRNTRHDVAMS